MQIKEYKEDGKQFYSCRIWYYKNKQKKSKYREGFTRKKDAEAWGINEKRRLEGLQPGAEKIRVSEFLERWIKTKEKKLSPTTLNGYMVNIRHINKYIGDIELHKLKLIDVQEMLDDLSKSGLKYRTVKYVWRTLHAALEYAVKTELIEKNVSKGAEIADDEKKFEVVVYSAEDLKNLILLLRKQEHPLYPAVLLSSMRGLRRGECLGLRWADIDFEKGIAYIRNNYVIVNKKSYHKKVKTKDSERIISIDGFVAEELKAYREKIKNKGTIQTYVCEIDGKLPNPSHISRQLKSFQKANNLPLCRFHDLRHTFAVLQLEFGTDLDTLKRLLGHSKLSVTSDLYLHQNINLIKKASLEMDNIVKMHCDNIVTFSEKSTADKSKVSG